MPSVDTEPLPEPPEDEEEPDEISWNLGFVEEPEKPHLLLRHRFPSKVGGRPAWLDPVRLPSREQLTCGASGRPLDFLMQLYAPADANPEEGFHRALFLFISPEGGRLTAPGAVRLFRCLLPRANPYYSPNPPRDRDKYPQPLTPADQAASRERDPWRAVDAERPPAAAAAAGSGTGTGASGRGGRGQRQQQQQQQQQQPAEAGPGPGSEATAAEQLTGAAGPEGAAGPALPREGLRGPGGLYPELELIVEPEDDYRDEEGEDEWEEVAEGEEGKEAGGRGGSAAAAGTAGAGPRTGGVEAEARRALAEYRTRVAAEGELDEEELPPDVMEALEAAQGPEERAFIDFQARVSLAPQQVVRYCFQDGARPLWPAPHAQPGPGDIPPCPHCGSRRKLEFQVLPQLLHFLALDEEDPAAPDWSTLVAYTCAASCSPPRGADSAYMEEVVWVQGAGTQQAEG